MLKLYKIIDMTNGLHHMTIAAKSERGAKRRYSNMGNDARFITCIEVLD